MNEMIQNLLKVARTKWDIPNDVHVLPIGAKTVIIPIVRKDAWDEAVINDMFTASFLQTMHDLGHITLSLDEQMAVAELGRMFDRVEISTEPVGDFEMGYNPEVNVLAFRRRD